MYFCMERLERNLSDQVNLHPTSVRTERQTDRGTKDEERALKEMLRIG